MKTLDAYFRKRQGTRSNPSTIVTVDSDESVEATFPTHPSDEQIPLDASINPQKTLDQQPIVTLDSDESVEARPLIYTLNEDITQDTLPSTLILPLKRECFIELDPDVEKLKRQCAEKALHFNDLRPKSPQRSIYRVDSDDEDDESPYKKGRMSVGSKRQRNPGTWEVEKIVDYRFRKQIKKETYLIKWRWWDEEHNTWEFSENLGGCTLLKEEYHQRMKLNVRKQQKYDLLLAIRNSIEDICDSKFEDFGFFVKLLRQPILGTQCSKTKLQKWKKDLRKKVSYLWDYPEELPKRQRDYALDIKVSELLDKAIKDLNIVHVFRKPEDKDLDERHLKKKCAKAYLDFFQKRWDQMEKLEDLKEDIDRKVQEAGEAPVELQNWVDLDLPPSDFEYITKCVPAEDSGIVVNTEPVIYCACGPDSHCDSETCNCFEAQKGIYYDAKGRVLKNIPSSIHECNSKCSCSSSCYNRVTQKGRKHKVAIFKTNNGTGWGVKSLERIPRGTFVFEYVGEYINDEQADVREQMSKMEGRPTHSYFFDLDLEEQTMNKYTIDAARKGNVSHFVNHSCEPNLDNICVFIDCQLKDMPQIMFFTVRDIRPEEELTFDYNMHVNVKDGGSVANESDVAQEEDFAEQVVQKTGEEDSGMESGADSEKILPLEILETPSTSQETNDEEIRQITLKKFFPPIERIACRCGAKKCRGFLF